MSSDSQQTMFIIGGIGLVALMYFTMPRTLSQSEQFRLDFRNLSKMPISQYDPLHTPVPGQKGWEYNYNRS